MKLSKAQQEVVDKMREGCIITRVKGLYPYVYISPAPNIERMNFRTFEKLLSLGVIEVSHSADVYDDYRLTEQYKPQQNEH